MREKEEGSTRRSLLLAGVVGWMNLYIFFAIIVVGAAADVNRVESERKRVCK